ncbi:MAG TPA: ASCH domain-containing protein [Phenylobacterium sp.]|jgi:uncharacterized protein YhfF
MGAAADWSSLESFSFGDSPQMADDLLASVLAGEKTATCWSVAEGELTTVGKRMVVKDGAGEPRVVLETVELTQRRFDAVDEAFALAEGEGIRSLQDWRDSHQRYFARNGGFSPDMMLWCERFRLVEILPIEDLAEGDGQ